MPRETTLPLRPPMPNTGKPSGGCKACREMKVKCGEERPSCKRCERAGRVCLYREPRDSFIDMREAARWRAHNPVKRNIKRGNSVPESGSSKRLRSASPKRRTATPQSVKHSSASGRSSDSPQKAGANATVAVLAQPMSIDWEEAAIAFYVSEFVIEGSKRAGHAGHMEFLPDLIQEESHNPHFMDALKSVALSTMGNRSCMEQLSVHADRLYIQAITGVNKVLGDPILQTADGTLMTLILLGQYETVTGEHPDQLFCSSHSKGQAALLSLRGTEQFSTERGRALFRLAQSRIQLSASSEESLPWWQGQLPKDLFRHDFGWKFYDANQQIHETRRTTKILMAETTRPDGWYTRLRAVLLQQGEVLKRMEAMLESCRSAPMSWYWRAQDTNQSDPDSPSFRELPNVPLPRYAFVFASLLIAGVLLNFWTLIAKFVDGMLNTSTLLHDSHYKLPPVLAPQVLQHKLTKAVDDASASMPFLFGEIDSKGGLRPGGHAKSVIAYLALWPIHVLGGLQALDRARRSWILARLTQLGTVYGIRQALHLRDWRLRTTATATTSMDKGKQASTKSPPPTLSVTIPPEDSSLFVMGTTASQPADPLDPLAHDPLDSPRELWFPDL